MVVVVVVGIDFVYLIWVPHPHPSSVSFTELKAAQLVRTGSDLETALPKASTGWLLLVQVMKAYKG